MSAFKTGDSQFLLLLVKCLLIAAIGLSCIYLIAPKQPVSSNGSEGKHDLLSKPLGLPVGQ
jgi:hypothetical protein